MRAVGSHRSAKRPIRSHVIPDRWLRRRSALRLWSLPLRRGKQFLGVLKSGLEQLGTAVTNSRIWAVSVQVHE